MPPLAKRPATRAPLWGGPQTDGVTFSLLSRRWHDVTVKDAEVVWCYCPCPSGDGLFEVGFFHDGLWYAEGAYEEDAAVRRVRFLNGGGW